jgi:RNA polymerase sigma-70 factor (ECF subfamily)
MQDEQAVARLKQGDLGSLEALVSRYYLPAVRAAFLILQDKGSAEDVVQTSFLNLASTIQQYDSRRPFGPWFLRCVVNTAINANYRESRLVSMNAMEEESGFSAEEWLREQAGGPEEQAEASDRRQAILAALANLSSQQRAVVVMRYYLELSENEMAAELDCPKSSLKWWLYSARLRLRELLHAFAPAGFPAPSDKEKRQ